MCVIVLLFAFNKVVCDFATRTRGLSGIDNVIYFMLLYLYISLPCYNNNLITSVFGITWLVCVLCVIRIVYLWTTNTLNSRKLITTTDVRERESITYKAFYSGYI